MKYLFLTLITVCQFVSYASASGNSIETQIEVIHAQDNRVWIFFTPGISNTACTEKGSIEIQNEGVGSNPNRDLILTVAMAAQASGQSVQWITSDNCSNVGRDLVRGIRLVR